MKILFVTATYLPVINGVSFQIDILKKALEERGHTVYVLAPSFPNFEDTEPNILRYPSLPNPLVKTYPLGIPLYSTEKIKRLKPDIVHTHHPSLIGQFAQTISKNNHAPLFFTAHTQYEMYLNYYLPHLGRFTSFLLNKDLRNLASKCYKIICPTNQTRSKLNAIGIKNTIVINNGIENSFFKKPREKTLDRPTLVYTGRIVKEKDPFLLLKIALELKKVLPNFRLIIIGRGSLLERLIKKTHSYKLHKNVLIKGEISRTLLPEIYGSAHLFITTSVSEVMPVSIVEAMASGLPVIGLKNSNLESIVIDNLSGILVNKDPRTIARQIQKLLSDRKSYSSLSLSTFKFSRKFAASKTIEGLERCYFEALSGHSEKFRSTIIRGDK